MVDKVGARSTGKPRPIGALDCRVSRVLKRLSRPPLCFTQDSYVLDRTGLRSWAIVEAPITVPSGRKDG